MLWKIYFIDGEDQKETLFGTFPWLALKACDCHGNSIGHWMTHLFSVYHTMGAISTSASTLQERKNLLLGYYLLVVWEDG